MKLLVRKGSQKLLRYNSFLPKCLLLLFLNLFLIFLFHFSSHTESKLFLAKDALLERDSSEDATRSAELRSKRRPTAVIIFTEMRSGSSFIGEFFNQHPEVTYLFEPLHSFGSTCDVMKSVKVKLLNQLVACNFSDFSKIHRRVLNETKETDRRSKCASKGICFQSRSAFIRRNPALCRQPTECENPLSHGEVSKACLRSLMPVIKTVRVCRISELRNILEDWNINVKIIHVVRDPRGIIASRRQLYEVRELPGTFNMSREVATLCLRHLHSINDIFNVFQANNRPSLYKMDFYADPTRAMETMYDFVGLNPSWATENWIRANTKMERANSSPYSTERDAKFEPEKWRKKLKPKEILEVTYGCAEVLYNFGYL